MEISPDKNDSQASQPEPVAENEALKNTEEVNEDKIYQEPKGDDELPGYPHYPAEEDILNPSNSMERVDADVEFLTRAGNLSETDIKQGPATPAVNDMEFPAAEDEDEDIGIVPGTEADVTAEDLLILGPKDQDMDMGEDEAMQNKGFPLGMTGEDLDVPGLELDDSTEALGQDDEENSYYSLGGDNKED